MVCFEWDDRKATTNFKKHGVHFEVAKSCFDDDHAISFHDPDHSIEEDRDILIGLSYDLKTLVVVFTERSTSTEDIIRIISARKATKLETQYYWSKRN